MLNTILNEKHLKHYVTFSQLYISISCHYYGKYAWKLDKFPLYVPHELVFWHFNSKIAVWTIISFPSVYICKDAYRTWLTATASDLNG